MSRMGTKPTPVRITPSWSSNREQNIRRVRNQIMLAKRVDLLPAFDRLVAPSNRKELDRASTVAGLHPLQYVAEQLGVECHFKR